MKEKKPIYKKWWFWSIIVVIIAASYAMNGTDNNAGNNDKEPVVSSEQNTGENQDKDTSEETISFSVSDVRNDVTGNWRIAKIAENIDMKDHALDYYKKYFKSDSEIHAIVNFNDGTTTRISVMGNLLNVCVHEYVSKEEHDAKLLFSGKTIGEYLVNKDNGEIQKVN